MKILLLGSGGREHAFAWSLSQSSRCEALYIAPGNAGTASCGENVPISATDFPALAAFCLERRVDMVIVGPEAPLVEGIYDFFQAEERYRHIPVIGPSAKGAALEGSKAFAKAFMIRHDIPTAGYREFDAAQLDAGTEYLRTQQPPIVLKADGLAAGKGVLICATVEEAVTEFREMLSGKFGAASARVVVEEFMTGLEFSVFVLTDGSGYRILPVAKDYKRIGEGDQGLNTGGMGAVSDPPFVTKAMMEFTETHVIKPTIEGLQRENIPYKGIIYIGLMNTPEAGPRVVEYNCRMGDPETQAVFPRIESDMVDLMEAVAKGTVADFPLKISRKAAATVILASGGYPGDYEKGKVISGLDGIGDSLAFFAGVARDPEGRLVTDGGRVLAITSLHEDWKKALALSNKAADAISFEGKYFRRDIGFDL